MRTLDEVLNQFGYHPATPDSNGSIGTATLHDRIRQSYSDHAADIWDMIPDGPEKTLAMRKLQESLMYANLAVALTAPVDDTTSGVARVLPE